MKCIWKALIKAYENISERGQYLVSKSLFPLPDSPSHFHDAKSNAEVLPKYLVTMQ